MKTLKTSIWFLFVSTLVLVSCKSYYNEAIDWMDNIKLGTSLQDVKKDQPDFVDINWEDPDSLDNQVRFMVTSIKGNNDALRMSQILLFVDNKFQGRESHK